MGSNKFVHLMFAVGTLLIAYLVAKTSDWVWGYFSKPNDLVINSAAVLCAVVAGVVAYKNERVYGAAVDVTRELEKVTWPTRKETYAATIVVIVMVGISALILTVFDYVWSAMADWILR
jgi:preprotein translocase subunit SecE